MMLHLDRASLLVRCFPQLLLVLCCAQCHATSERRLIEEQSLIPPARPEDGVPQWNLTEAITIRPGIVRLTETANQEASIWNMHSLPFQDWEVEVEMNISNHLPPNRADGWALFYTEKASRGGMFGSEDSFRGLAVVIDTYSNRKQFAKFVPFVQAHIYDGTRTYDRLTDGTRNMTDMCEADMTPSNATTKIRVRYQADTLTVWTAKDAGKWSSCFQVYDVDLPKGYFLGVGARTNAEASMHDLLSLKTYELDGPSRSPLELHRLPEHPNLSWDDYKIGSFTPECACVLAHGHCRSVANACPLSLLRIEDSGHLVAATLNQKANNVVTGIGETLPRKYHSRSPVHAQILCYRHVRDFILSWQEYSLEKLELTSIRDRLVSVGRSLEGDRFFVCRPKSVEPPTLGVFIPLSGRCRFASQSSVIRNTELFDMLLVKEK